MGDTPLFETHIYNNLSVTHYEHNQIYDYSQNKLFGLPYIGGLLLLFILLYNASDKSWTCNSQTMSYELCSMSLWW